VSWKQLDAQDLGAGAAAGITFHDGTPFTTADVVFSIERAKAENSSVRAAVSGVAGVEAVDADTLRFSAATAHSIPWKNL